MSEASHVALSELYITLYGKSPAPKDLVDQPNVDMIHEAAALIERLRQSCVVKAGVLRELQSMCDDDDVSDEMITDWILYNVTDKHLEVPGI